MPTIPHPRFMAFLAVFAAGAALALMALPVPQALVVGFDLGAVVFLLSALPLLGETEADALRRNSARDDGGRLVLLALAALVPVVILTALAQMTDSAKAPANVALVLGTLVLAWLFSNLVYAFHYAHLYYDPAEGGSDMGGLDFPGTPTPTFADFCYFAFGIGMAFQVGDVVVRTATLRLVVTLHGMLGFFYNLGVLSFAINVLAGVL